MSKILKNLIQSVLLGSMATIVESGKVAGNDLNEINSNLDLSEYQNADTSFKSVSYDKNFVLKKSILSEELLFASHRSHRSHSSHRSHYSSSPSPAPPRPTPRPTNTTPSSTSSVQPNQLKLGDRILVLGMIGADVNELMIILVKHKYLDIKHMNSKSTFTEEVRDALIKFQTANQLIPNGRTTPETVIKLKALDR